MPVFARIEDLTYGLGAHFAIDAVAQESFVHAIHVTRLGGPGWVRPVDPYTH